jgi:hypothetical protein
MVLLYVRLLSLLRTLPTTSSVRDESYNVMITGLGIFILGFAVWNVDNYFCEGLTQWRKIVGEVFGWVSQGLFCSLFTYVSRLTSFLIYRTCVVAPSNGSRIK